MVHADETGWRQDGVNGYIWTFSTPTDRYFLRRGRGKEVVDEALGDSFDWVLVSDFYAAYNHYPGLKQRCWVHLLRDIRDLEALYPDDAGLSCWARAVRQLYDEAKVCAAAVARKEPGYQRSVSPNQLALERQLLSLCRPFSNNEVMPHAKLCRRIERGEHTRLGGASAGHVLLLSPRQIQAESQRPLSLRRAVRHAGACWATPTGPPGAADPRRERRSRLAGRLAPVHPRATGRTDGRRHHSPGEPGAPFPKTVRPRPIPRDH